MAELADAADSKSAEVNSRVGSSPTFGTTLSKDTHLNLEIDTYFKRLHADRSIDREPYLIDGR